MNDSEIKVLVKESYGKIARTGGSCCPTKGSCCGTLPPEEISKNIGYSEEEMNAVPQGANLGLGCGNPIALASIKEGETVLDLGSGAGFDSFLAANRVGPTGKVIGVDMTPEMINRARENADKGSYSNVQFVPGELEDLPVDDNSMDAVISNCVINLSADKDAVLREAFRVLRPGGRFAVSDIVLTREIPAGLRGVVALWTGCISGSLLDLDYLAKLEAAGFVDAGIEVTREYDRDALEAMGDMLDPAQLPASMSMDDAVEALEGAFASAFIRATKPRG